ncbi:MAG: RNA polymerase sigma-70 factor [Bacteroidales bacterium]|nr:RNA polymerase sigma-70 factor [Bacteroidales bacterium]
MDNYIGENNFQDIYEAYFRPICRFLNLYTKNESVIEDVVQDVFCNLWTNRDFLQIKHVRSYLYTSARNKMLNYIRDEKLHSSILATYMLEEKQLQEAYECVDKEIFTQKLEKAIDELPVKCKNVFLLSRYDKLTYKEIAQKERISEKMVEKHISVALKKIKGMIKGKQFILL